MLDFKLDFTMACLHSRIAAEAAFAVAVKNSAVIAVQVI